MTPTTLNLLRVGQGHTLLMKIWINPEQLQLTTHKIKCKLKSGRSLGCFPGMIWHPVWVYLLHDPLLLPFTSAFCPFKTLDFRQWRQWTSWQPPPPDTNIYKWDSWCIPREMRAATWLWQTALLINTASPEKDFWSIFPWWGSKNISDHNFSPPWKFLYLDLNEVVNIVYRHRWLPLLVTPTIHMGGGGLRKQSPRLHVASFKLVSKRFRSGHLYFGKAP